MLLETGGEAKFRSRLVEGVSPGRATVEPEQLILDGQQRLTSLTQVLQLHHAVKTVDDKKRNVERFYYLDVNLALSTQTVSEDLIIAVDGSKTLRTNFGRDVILDLSKAESEYRYFYFPCNWLRQNERGPVSDRWPRNWEPARAAAAK